MQRKHTADARQLVTGYGQQPTTSRGIPTSCAFVFEIDGRPGQPAARRSQTEPSQPKNPISSLYFWRQDLVGVCFFRARPDYSTSGRRRPTTTPLGIHSFECGGTDFCTHATRGRACAHVQDGQNPVVHLPPVARTWRAAARRNRFFGSFHRFKQRACSRAHRYMARPHRPRHGPKMAALRHAVWIWGSEQSEEGV